MLQLRPTFSESWYRVVNLRPKLRGTAQISRQYYRGDRWYVVRDPAGNQFHRVSDAAYRFIGLLDGRRTVGEAWDLVGGQLADDAPTQPEVIQLLSQLYAANVIETDVPPDAMVLLRRHKQLQKRQMQGRLMNVLFPRIPIWDCDNFLKRWMPLVRPFLSTWGAIVWLVVVIGAIASIAPEWTALKDAAIYSVNIRENPINAFYLYTVFVLIKFIHELGHAFSCRRFGGEVHEMGIMFLVFIPTPYVDASTAWAFPSRWARMFVGAGGMIIELFVAAICAFIWKFTTPGSVPNMLAYNAMLIASVSTIIFNANPLLRYDGYYMLSDFLEIPNLQQKSKEYALGLIKRHIFRIKATQPLPPILQRVWLFVYCILSSIYRVFVGIAIVLMVTWTIPVIGVLMAIGGVITWAIVPVVKTFKYLTIDPELHRKRPRAIAFSLAVAAAIVLLVGVIKFPMRIDTEGAVEARERSVLHAETAGFVDKVVAHSGDKLKKGDPILVCYNRELEAEIEGAKAKVQAAEIKVSQSRVTNQALRQIDQQSLENERQHLAELQRQADALTVRAPIDGELIAPDFDKDQVLGRFYQRGDEICRVAKLDQLLVRAVLEQRDATLAVEHPQQAPGTDPAKWTTEVQLIGRLGKIMRADHYEVINAAQNELPDPLLGTGGGGQEQIDPRDPKGKKAVQKQFEMRIVLDNPYSTYLPGQRAYVRVTLGKVPLGEQWTRRFWQLVRSRSNSKWL
jgi:putative peptide zinc metalloprotease protein